MKRRPALWLLLSLAPFWPPRPAISDSLRVVVPANRSEAFVAPLPLSENAPGLDYEILSGFARLRRLELQVKEEPTWDGLIPALAENRADVIAGGFTDTEIRRQSIAFTVEVFPSRDVVVSRVPHRVIGSLEELRQEKVVTHQGTSMAEALHAVGVPEANIEYITTGSVSDRLRSRKATAGVLGLEVAILARRHDPEMQLGMFLGRPASLAYGVRKTDPLLKQALDAYLVNLRRTATWNRLVVKYFGEDALEILKRARQGP